MGLRAEFQFVSWARSGVGAIAAGGPSTIHVALGSAGEARRSIAPYGPGDVTALDVRAIVRTVPRAGAMDFEPNLFPSVELAHPALPWMLSPQPDGQGRVTPWIVLIIVADRPGVALTAGTGDTRVLSIEAPASPAEELPDLGQAWAWGHGQTTSDTGAAIDPHAFTQSTGEARGRLLAARRLAPGKNYLACVVPAFAAGGDAALRQPPRTGLAWTRTETAIRLPVYFAWRFGTGPGGDFASLARLIKPESLSSTVGHRTVDISDPDWGMPRATGAKIEVSGALRSRLGDALAAVSDAFQPLQVTPVLDQPLVHALQALSPEHVMPGVGGIVANRAALANTAPEVVRAFLVGANEELGRELLWRGFPGALGHTWLQTFWGRTVLGENGAPTRVPDIPAIETWPDAGAVPAPATLVLVVRAEVLHRYPNALVYALAARWDGKHRVVGGSAPLAPVIAAALGSDIALFGFDLDAATARGSDAPPGSPGWYFVIAEHPSEPQFGLAASSSGPPTGWSAVAWSDVAAGDLAGSYLRTDGPLAARSFAGDPLRWGTDAAAMAAIAHRRAIRVALHASTLLPPV